MEKTVNIIVVDISGRVDIYDDALYDSLSATGINVKMLRPRHGLLSFVPYRYATSTHALKRILKLTEGVFNYIYLGFLLLGKKCDVLHLQWLPFMDFCSIEVPILKVFRIISPKTKIILTIHNVYPHNMNDAAKTTYNKRFKSACCKIDSFIVHTKISKSDVIKEFDLPSEKVNVCYHGVFVPKGITISSCRRQDECLKVLQFGGQSYYKGTDILVDALCKMDDFSKERIETHIVGGISPQYLSELKNKVKNEKIVWKPYFLSYPELYEEINNSDLIVLPYRAISQSGVLLTAIYFEKLIVCSDLPSFRETMAGEDLSDLENVLFTTEDPTSLRLLLEKYMNKEVNETEVLDRVKKLKYIYSWEHAAKQTLEVYRTVI